jgi:tetratricopeptide (TPR) repeat protein
MATRVNTKFVLGLCIVLLLLVGGVVGVWFVIESRSADRYIRLAEDAQSNGDLVKATAFYGRAVYRRPSDLDLIDRFSEKLLVAEIDSQVKAQNYLRDYIGSKRQAAERSNNDPRRLEDYYETLYRLARRFNQTGYYNQLVEATGNRLASDPDNRLARRYRGLATVPQIARDTPADIRDRALNDLLRVVEADSLADLDPDALPTGDIETLVAIAEWSLKEASRIDQPGENVGDRPEEADRLRETAVAIATRMLEAGAGDPLRQTHYIRLLAQPALNPQRLSPHPSGQAVRGVVDAFLAQAAAAAAAERDAVAFVNAISILPSLYPQPTTVDGHQTNQGLAFALQAMQDATQAHPEVLVFKYVTAELNRRIGRLDAAGAGYDRVIASGEQADFRTFLEGQQYVPLSFHAKGNLAIATIEQADADEQEAILDRVAAMADEIALRVGEESPLVDTLRGKIALQRGNMARATALFDRASARLNERNLELLLLSAQAREGSGQPGAAVARYEQVLALQPGLAEVRLQHARLLLKLGRVEPALAQLRAVLEADPDNAAARQLAAVAMLESGQDNAQQAITAMEAAAEAGGVRELVTLASVYLNLDERDKARQVVQRALAADPADPRAVRLALGLDPDPQTRREIIRNAADAGMPAERVELLLAAIDAADADTDEARRALVERLLDQNEDPVTRKLAEVRLFADREDSEDARRGQEALDELIAEHADEPRVIEFRFQRALLDDDLDLAAELVETAVATDADLAGGEFYRARLLNAQGQSQRAILTMTSALEARPVYSQGWLWLARLHRDADEADKALDAAERAVSQSPDNVAALAFYAQLSAELGRFDQALEAAREGARRAPRNQAIQRFAISLEQRHGNLDRAIEQRQQWAESNPEDRDNLRQLAIALASRGDVQQAIDTLDRAASEDDEPLDTVRARAALYTAADRPQDGFEVFQGYLRAKGDQATAFDYIAFAQFLIENNNRGLAARALVQARSLEDPDTMPASRVLGDLLFSANRNQEAAEVYADVLESKPDDVAVRLRLAETNLRLGNIDEATTVLDDPSVADSDTATLVRALAARDAGDLPAALRLVNQLITASPNRPDLYTHRATILAQQDNRGRMARADLERALSIDPDYTLARVTLAGLHQQAGDNNAAIDELQRLVARQPDLTDGYRQLAGVMINAGRGLDAEVVLVNAAERFAGDPTWPRMLAQLAAQRGDRRDAIAYHRAAYGLSSDARDLLGLIEAMLTDRQAQQAMSLFDELDESLLNLPGVRSMRASAHAQLGNREQATADFEAAIDAADSFNDLTAIAREMTRAFSAAQAVETLDRLVTDDRRPLARLVTARVLASTDPAAAVQRIEGLPEALADQPALRAIAHRTAGVAAYQIEAFETAESHYRAALELDPDDASTLNNLAYLLVVDRDDLEAGLPLARRAAELMPNNARVLDTHGLAQLRLGQARQAVDTLRRSYTLEQMPINALHLGMAYGQVGNTSQARQMLNSAIRLAERDGEDQIGSRARDLLTQYDTPAQEDTQP